MKCNILRDTRITFGYNVMKITIRLVLTRMFFEVYTNAISLKYLF